MLEFCFIGAAMKPGAYDALGRRKYLNKNENRKFLKAAETLDPAEATFCLTLYYCGCRISEALSLTTNDIDWETHVIRFRSLKKRDKVVMRRVPIPSTLTRRLKLLKTDDDTPLLWPYSRTTGWRIVKTVMKKAQISGIHATAKGLRHGFGVRGAMERIPVHLLRDWMGHADISTTAIYLDIRDEEERELIKRTWKQ